MLLLMVMVIGCAHRVVIPDEPNVEMVEVVYLEDGICMDTDNVQILWNNLQKMKAYCDEMRKELEKCQ
jgi:hypothetical protein